MKLTFFGAARAVTGSCHCVECGGKKILVDCGLQQGRDERDNQELCCGDPFGALAGTGPADGPARPAFPAVDGGDGGCVRPPVCDPAG